jgi:muramidase (phage lysozyme)
MESTRTAHKMIRMAAVIGLLFSGTLAGPAAADLFEDRTPLVNGARQPMFAARKAPRVQSASLFTGRKDDGLFGAVSRRPMTGPLTDRSVAARLRDLIALAEAGRAGYDAVQYGARIRPAKPPTRMTLREIEAWTRATPGQPHAIGRYQFIPPTLRRLTAKLDLAPGTRFSPDVQDRLGDLLLAEAGLAEVQRGEITQDAFLLNLSKIWAGLPTSSGRSYYHGVAGNKATMGWERYARAVRKILDG